MTSKRGWSCLIASPSFTSHRTISPSFTPSPISGSLKSNVAMALLLVGRRHMGRTTLSLPFNQTFHEKFARLIAGPHERTARHIEKPHPFSCFLPQLKFFGRDIFDHFEM